MSVPLPYGIPSSEIFIMATINQKSRKDSEGQVSPEQTDDALLVTREKLIDLLNEDLSREYQAIIAYVSYSQILKGPEYMHIAAELEQHAVEELQHALEIARQIDYLGGVPNVTPSEVKISEDSKTLLKYDLENEEVTIRNYRRRVRQCQALGEFAIAETIRKILVQEQDHQIELSAALKLDAPARKTAE